MESVSDDSLIGNLDSNVMHYSVQGSHRMETPIIVALIGAIVTILIGVATHFLTKRREIEQRELEFKLELYKEFLSTFSELGGSHKSYDSHLKIASAVSTINLVGSAEVIINIYSLLEYMSAHRDEGYSVEEQDEIIRRIVLSIRKDLRQPCSGEFEKIKFKIISPGGSEK